MSVILRDMERSDLETVLKWRNTESVRHNMYTHHEISWEEHLSWWEEQNAKLTTVLLICEIEREAVGVVIFTNYSGEGGSTTWAFYSGDTSKRGIGSHMEKAGLAYAFDTLKVLRLECEVLEFNKPVIKFHIKHGFQVEGILRDAYIRDGKPYDIYKLAMLKNEWFDFVKPNIKLLGRKGPNSLVGKKYSFEHIIEHEHSNGFLKFFSEKTPGLGTVYLGQSLKFLRPIPLGAKVNVEIKFLSHIGRKVKAEVRVYCEGELCIDGDASLWAPKIKNVESRNED